MTTKSERQEQAKRSRQEQRRREEEELIAAYVKKRVAEANFDDAKLRELGALLAR